MSRLNLTLKHALAATLVLAIPAAICIGLWYFTRDDNPPDLADGAKPLKGEPTEIVPGIYLLGKLSPSVAYAVDTTEGIVLIDSGLDSTATGVIKQLSDLGLDPGRLKAIFLTHVHADHSLGAAKLRDRFGAKIYAGKEDCEPIRTGGPRDAFLSTFQMPDVTLHLTTVDVALAGGEVIEFGDARFEVIAAPGHTPGSMCYLLERRGVRALFAGDVIQALNPATRDFLGTYAAYLPPRYRGNAADYLATLRNLRSMSPPHLVFPGHPSMDAEPQNPQIGIERWHQLLDQGIAEMETLEARLHADGANFLDGNPKELVPGLKYLGDRNGSAAYSLECSKGLFLFDAPGGDLVDLKGRKPTAVILTSAGPEATAGLAELVRQIGCKVVAPKAGLDIVRRLCPEGTEILTEDKLANAGWFIVRAIPLAGRGLAPVAYEFLWAGKSVLISGRIPQKLNSQSLIDLMGDVRKVPGGPEMFHKSLDELRKLKPDLWLPAVPIHGQNANLYDREWETVLDRNAEAFP